MTASALLEAGFGDPVIDGQATFRAILDALANPGTITKLTLPGIVPPLPAGLAALLLTLADHDTPVWFGPSLPADTRLAEWVAFHTAAPIITTPSAAQFAVGTAATDLPLLGEFALGTDEYPDRSTTIILGVPNFAGGPPLTLRGPGIAEVARIAPLGLPPDFVAQWTANRALFPRGIDLLLVCEDRVIGLPRCTRIAGDQ